MARPRQIDNIFLRKRRRRLNKVLIILDIWEWPSEQLRGDKKQKHHKRGVQYKLGDLVEYVVSGEFEISGISGDEPDIAVAADVLVRRAEPAA